jgi:hypothetical protein
VDRLAPLASVRVVGVLFSFQNLLGTSPFKATVFQRVGYGLPDISF